MSPSEPELRTLYDEAGDMPYGRAKSRALETVVRHADAQGLDELAFDARMDLTSAYSSAGEAARMFVPFARCLAAHDRDPGAYGGAGRLLWHYKWIISEMVDHPEIGLAQIDRALDDYERRLRRIGGGMNAVHMMRCRVAGAVGRAQEAAERYRAWCAAPRDEHSDCRSCEPRLKASYLSRAGRHEEAVAMAEPGLSAETSCWLQPRALLATLLLPYLRTGRREDAVRAHRRILLDERAVDPDDGEPYDLHTQLAFYVGTGNEARALEVLEPHLPEAGEEYDDASSRMWRAASVALVMRRLAALGRGDLVAGGRTVREWYAERRGIAEHEAARFDERNGTSYVGDRVRARMELEPLGPRLALSG